MGLRQTPGGSLLIILGIFLLVSSRRKSKKKTEQVAKSTEQRVKSFPDTFVAFDVETTGVDTRSCEIIQIAGVKVVNGKVKDKFTSYARPIGTIPEAATAINGISYDMVADAPDLKTVLS